MTKFRGEQGIVNVVPLVRGRFQARLASGAAEIAASQRLRHLAFRAARGLAGPEGADIDSHDARAHHMLILDGDDLVASYRVNIWQGGDVLNSYTARHYDLAALSRFPAPMVELGRFCLHPDRHDPDILRLAWAAMAMVVDQGKAGLMFGCSSFSGADPTRHMSALAELAPHVGPETWRPRPMGGERVDLAGLASLAPRRQALQGIPALLRSYLGMGGWVSDHAVLDRELDTLHVFTAVEVAKIPVARAAALRLIAATSMG